jgi:hypothetical protein
VLVGVSVLFGLSDEVLDAMVDVSGEERRERGGAHKSASSLFCVVESKSGV